MHPAIRQLRFNETRAEATAIVALVLASWIGRLVFDLNSGAWVSVGRLLFLVQGLIRVTLCELTRHLEPFLIVSACPKKLPAMRLFALLLISLLFSWSVAIGQDPLEKYREAAKEWESDIAKFEELDRTEPPVRDAILFVGSSSFRMWETMAEDMKPWPVVRRGFGGCRLSDIAIYAPRLLARPYRALVLFSANDIKGEEGDKSPQEVAQMFALIVAESKKRQPDAPIFIIAITPNEKRWGVWAIQKMANGALRKVCESDPQLHFIATEEKYLTSRGFPRRELFVEDKLHQNAEGYQLWSSIIRQQLTQVLKTSRIENP